MKVWTFLYESGVKPSHSFLMLPGVKLNLSFWASRRLYSLTIKTVQFPTTG